MIVTTIFKKGKGDLKIPGKYIITIYHEMFNSLSHTLESHKINVYGLS